MHKESVETLPIQEAYLIMDIGTGSVRAAVVSADTGRILAMESAKTRMYSDPRMPRAQYFLPEELLDDIFSLVPAALQKASEVSCGETLRVLSMTASSFREGIVLVGQDGAALTGYTNADRRGEGCLGELDWGRITGCTGLEKSAIYSGLKMMGARRLDPELYQKTAFFTSVSDWVGYALTGNAVWERAQAMHSALYDPVRDAWSGALCRDMDIDPALLPPLADAGQILGEVRGSDCARLGLPAGTPYIIGTADTQAAVTASGAGIGDIVTVSGTSSPCVRILDRFELIPRSWVSPTAEPARFMLEVNTFSCGITLQRFKDLFLPDLSYRALDEGAVAIGLPETGLPPLYAVFMNGMHVDHPMSEGGFTMSNPMKPELQREDFFHAISLNIAMSITLCMERHREILREAGAEARFPKELIGVGGGLVSPVIGQAVSDLTKTPLRLPAGFREATILGSSMLSADALRRPRPVHEDTDRILYPRASAALDAYYGEWKERRQRIGG